MAISYDFTDGNKLIYKFDLDVCCEQETPIIRVPKNTEGAFVEITLTKNGTPLTLDQSKAQSPPVLILHCPEIDSPTLQERTSTGTIQWSQTNTPIRFTLPIEQINDTILENGRHCAYVELHLSRTETGTYDYTSILCSQMFYVDLEGFPKKKHDVNTILNIVKVSATEYGRMGYHDPNTLFIVKSADYISIRLGNTPLIADGDTNPYNETLRSSYVDSVQEV